MAFSATISGQCPLPSGNGLKMYVGTWTGAVGDSAGTLAIAGGFPVCAIFQKFDPIDKTYQIIPRIETATLGGITTYTVENQDTVTSGSFMIIHGG